MSQSIERDAELLAEAQVFEESEAFNAQPPSVSPPKSKGSKGWQPKLGPIGTSILLDKRSKYILLHGERGSLKTGICLHKVCLELYENPNALWFIVSLTRTAATEGGAWDKFNSLTLPEWRDGINLGFTEPKMDDQKNRYTFVANKFGGWSKVILRSMPYGSNIAARMKGPEPSGFFFDELTETEAEDREYFTKPIQQLGRRPGIPYQPYLGACNPSELGEDHWVYQTFFVEPMDPETGKWNEDFAVHHIPIVENVWWDKAKIEEYQRSLLVEARRDPSAIRRTIHGEWVKRPTGIGLFAESFSAELHVRGNALNGEGLRPIPGFPMFVSYDLGPRYSSATIMQFVPLTNGKVIIIILDEVDIFNQRVIYRQMAKRLIERLKFWNATEKHTFKVYHISDESAVSQWRAGGEQGSYDAWEFEREFNKKWPEAKMRMIGAPKGKGSVSARVNLMTNKLLNGELFVSATCVNTITMFQTLSEDKKKPGHPAKGAMIHKFDGLTYAPFKMETGMARKVLQTKRVAPSLIRCGATPYLG